MKRLILAAAVTAIGLSYATGLQAQTGGQIPPIAGGYTNVTAIPVNDPAIKAISGALFKPTGAGPFPAVVYMIGCAGLDPPPIRAQLKTDIDHVLAKGMAILVVDSFTPRNEPEGVCANLDGEKAMQYFTRGGNDALAAVAVLKAMPEIDAKHIFLVGFSLRRHFVAASDRYKECCEPGQRGRRGHRLLSVLLRRRRPIGSHSRLDWRERRLDTSCELSGGHR